MTDAPDPELRAEYQKDLDKAKEATETAKNKEESAVKEMLQFYANLLSANAKYTWNKIVKEQTEQRLTITRTFKACPGKAQGNFCTSHLMTA